MGPQLVQGLGITSETESAAVFQYTKQITKKHQKKQKLTPRLCFNNATTLPTTPVCNLANTFQYILNSNTNDYATSGVSPKEVKEHRFGGAVNKKTESLGTINRLVFLFD